MRGVYYDEKTSKNNKIALERTFGKNIDPTISTLDWIDDNEARLSKLEMILGHKSLETILSKKMKIRKNSSTMPSTSNVNFNPSSPLNLPQFDMLK